MELKKIVITGGPCGGKSTALEYVKNALQQNGYTPLVVSETATDMITGGVAPWTCGTNYDFQKLQLQVQLKKEDAFIEAAKGMNKDRIVIVCDRGALDGKAYISEDEYKQMLKECGMTEKELLGRYDAVFHLMTAARGDTEFYTTSNNGARIETVDQAIEKDDRTMAAWQNHRNFRVIKNEKNFDDKMNNLVVQLYSALGHGAELPLEIERKFLIEMPDIEYLEQNCKRIDIEQVYLASENGEERRVRRKYCGIEAKYTYTTKTRVTDETRVERERKITAEEYYRLLMYAADPNKRPIVKSRYKYYHKGQCFEIDIYPFWKEVATAEIELADELQPIEFPPNIKVLADITGDSQFKNANLASLKDEELERII